MADTDDTSTTDVPDAPSDDTPDAPPATDADDTTEVEDTPLGPKGEKALEAIKEERRQLKEALRQRDAELAELRKSQMTAEERAIEEAREAARRETITEVQGRLFKAELRAAIATELRPEAQKDLLVKPEVALALLGLDEYPVTPDGDIDSEAISHAVTAYVAERPHLAASATQPPGPIDQGVRQTPAAKSLDDQIAEAEARGDWALAGRLKNQKLISAR